MLLPTWTPGPSLPHQEELGSQVLSQQHQKQGRSFCETNYVRDLEKMGVLDMKCKVIN